MASVRASLRQHARRLAHMTDGHGDVGQVPGWIVEQLRAAAQRAERPTSTLRWAWRSQHATYRGTGKRADGLAAVYLHAALLADQQGDRAGTQGVVTAGAQGTVAVSAGERHVGPV